MTRVLTAAPIAVIAFALILLLAAAALRTGFLPDDAATLWAGVISAGDGEISIGRIVSVYPSIPFLTTTAMEILTPVGTPTPALLAAVILGGIAGVGFLALRDSGLGIFTALAATVLIALHPALLRAAIAGPADMFFAVFLFMLGKGLYDLRAQSSTPEVMTVALALVGLAFSHPMGAAIAIASVPLLALAVRPALLANSAPNVVIALVFPTIFCAGAFVYVSWVFPGGGWSFFTAPTASLAAWAAGLSRLFGDRLTGAPVLSAGVMIAFALALGAPVAVAAIVWVRRRRPLVAPAVVFVAAVIVATMITVMTGMFGEPVSVVVAAPILAAIVVIRIPVVRERIPTVIALLLCGWVGGAAGIAVVDPRLTSHVRELLGGSIGDRDRIDELNLGHATIGREGVLVDSFNAPAVVLGRGQARGLIAPQGEGFMLTMLLTRIDAAFVAVPDPHSSAGAQDQLNKAFPKLYRQGAPGYRLVYQNPTWRLYESPAVPAVSND
jgi:membrane protein XagC